MKNLFEKLLVKELVFIAVMALLVLLVASANAQVNPNATRTLTIPTTIVGGGTSNLTSQPITIAPGRGVGVEVTFQSTTNTTTTSNTTWTVNASVDGSNWPTTAPWSFTVALNGTNVVRYYTNFPAAWFDSAFKARVQSGANGDSVSAITPLKVIISRAAR